jgi:ATP-binding cassette, subfamily B, bacterial
MNLRMREAWAGVGDAFSMVFRATAVNAAAQAGLTVLMGLAPIGAAWLTKSLLDSLGAGEIDAASVTTLAAAIAVLGLVTSIFPHLTRYAAANMSRQLLMASQRRLATALAQVIHGDRRGAWFVGV